jgi:hypothetical protein
MKTKKREKEKRKREELRGSSLSSATDDLLSSSVVSEWWCFAFTFRCCSHAYVMTCFFFVPCEGKKKRKRIAGNRKRSIVVLWPGKNVAQIVYIT